MTTYSSDFIKEITARGFIHQATDINNLDKLLNNSHIIPAYIGFDCTASSLHVGSLIQIMLLKWFQKCGHKPIVLLGGGTSLVGDPSGKDESRKLLNEDLSSTVDSSVGRAGDCRGLAVISRSLVRIRFDGNFFYIF